MSGGVNAQIGRKSMAYSSVQQDYLNYLTNQVVSDTRAEFVFRGHGVFRKLVNATTVANLRVEVKAVEDKDWSSIFNNNGLNKKRSMCKAPQLGPKVNGAIFEFLQTRALIATKWHKLALARHSSYLCSEPGAPRQKVHTDFDPSRMAKAVEDQPEFHIAKSFSVMTVLQPTKLYFADENGKLVPECMEAGDVVVFAGDTDHCGAEWSKKDGLDAFASFQDCNNYRLFCYVPSFYKVEYLVPWILREKNKDYLSEVAESVVVKTNLLDKMDPEKGVFQQHIFDQYLKYGGRVFHYNDKAYFYGIDTFPMRKCNRRLPQKVEQVYTEQACPHFAGVRADFFADAEDRPQRQKVQHQLNQLKLKCSYCSQSTGQTRKRTREDNSFEIDIERIEKTVPAWDLVGQTKLVKAAAKFVAAYKKEYPK